jgi:hypothetical protein
MNEESPAIRRESVNAPDAQPPPPAAWWNPSTANTSTTPTIVRWFDAAGREIPAPKDGYTDEQFRRASTAVARCFAADAEVAPTRSREFYNEIAHEVLVAVGAVSVASAALAGTTTPTVEAEVVKAAREFVRHTEMAIDAGWSGLGRPVFPYGELRAAVALLAAAPATDAQEG